MVSNPLVRSLVRSPIFVFALAGGACSTPVDRSGDKSSPRETKDHRVVDQPSVPTRVDPLPERPDAIPVIAVDTGEIRPEGTDTGTNVPSAEGEVPKTPPTKDAAVSADALLRSVRNITVADGVAMQNLAKARAAGAKRRALARAAVARGKALYAEPARAAAFFELAAATDKRSPDAVFELARQAAIEGDVIRVKKHLREVAARKGTGLLGQIEFDPTWAIVKDDPEIRGLLP